jgi:hypothetical protein
VLPSPVLEPPAGDHWQNEIKHDGCRMLLVRQDQPPPTSPISQASLAKGRHGS